jgi:hypothetical protein
MHFLGLASAVIGRCSVAPEALGEVTVFLKFAMDRKYDSFLVMKSCLAVVTALMKGFPAETTQLFAGSVFNILMADGFNPLNPTWEVYFASGANVHQRMLVADKAGFPAHFAAVVKAFGGTEEEVAAYLEPQAAQDKHSRMRWWWLELFDEFQGFSY